MYWEHRFIGTLMDWEHRFIGILQSRKTMELRSRGRGHDGLVNCVRTAMSKNVSISKTLVAANAIYSHKFAGHDVL